MKGLRFGMLLQIAVGPICLFIFQTAISSGFFTAFYGVIGVALIDSVFILSAILGIGLLLNKNENLKIGIKLFGALVLLFFGTSTLLEAFGFSILPTLSFLSAQSVESVMLKIMILTLSNPLTIIFWIGVFSSKLTDENLTQKDMYLFGFGAVLSTILFLSCISLAGSYINTFLTPVMLNTLNALVGIVLIGFGVNTAMKAVHAKMI